MEETIEYAPPREKPLPSFSEMSALKIILYKSESFVPDLGILTGTPRSDILHWLSTDPSYMAAGLRSSYSI